MIVYVKEAPESMKPVYFNGKRENAFIRTGDGDRRAAKQELEAFGQNAIESVNETQQQRYNYWVAFQDYAFRNGDFAREFKRRKPSMDHWMNYFIGSSECYISVSQIRNRDEINVALCIPDSKQLYQALLEQREEIEKTSGLSLLWYELPERKASKIIMEQTAELENTDKWNEQFDWLIDIMIKMKKAFKKYL